MYYQNQFRHFVMDAKGAAMADSGGVPFVVVTLLGAGMPWSEQEEGMTFRDWACKCF